MAANGHALLSASSAHRWLHCTAAPKLEATFPDTTSEYAREGTLAHAVCELKLLKYTTPMAKSTYTKKMKALKADPLYQPEMEETSETYLDYIKGVMLSYPTAPAVAVEKRVDFSKVVPEGFGTADCLLLAGDTIHVVDYKHGKGVVVSAENNPQMMLYALGAIQGYALLYHFQKVKMTIVQPRVNNISEFEMNVDDLMQWGETVVALQAQEALGDGAKFVPGGHCRFCRAKAQCKARSVYYAEMNEVAEAHRDPRLLTLKALGAYLTKAKELEKWAKDLEEYALSECLKGALVPGWKAVEGRGSRSFTDHDAAFKKLIAAGVEESVLYERQPITLAQAEKAVGKTLFADTVGAMVVKTPGKPTLAPAEDKRPAITNAPQAKDVFQSKEDKK